jgi:4-hydroxybenzoate polyprenyltransferase/phosphoserine phosphatase
MVSSSSGEMIPANSVPSDSGNGIGDDLPRFFARSADDQIVAAPFEAASAELLPLCVDLDGTLVRTDTLMEGMIALLGSMNPRAIIGAFAASRSGFKARVAELAPFDPALLPYNETLLEYIRAERAKGRRIVLATAANEAVAERVAAHLGLFDEVIASTSGHNLKGPAKAEALVSRFGAAGFVYAGDARADLAVWRSAAAAILVNVPRGVAAKVRTSSPIEHTIDDRPPRAAALLRAMRPHQWVKNLLVFVPIFTANAMGHPGSWVGGIKAFVAFCAVASSIYLANDLLDLAADRAHPHKRHRPFASGTAPLPAGIGLSLVLLLAGAAVAWQAGILAIVLSYAAMSLSYSFWLKRQPLVDVFLLAGLYTVRLIGGGEATAHSLSLWLLAFASFLFLSLALIKRVAEVIDSAHRSARVVSGRGYGPADLMILELFGVCSTFASSLVLALYVQFETAGDRYASPALLWGIVPLVLLWSCRMWLSTTRGYMHHDPIMYAARDWVTWAIVGAMVAVVLAARAGMPLP